MGAPDRGIPRVLHLRSSCGLYGAEGVIHGLVRSYAGPSTVLCLADAREPHTELCDLLAAEGRDAGTLSSRGALDPALIFRFAAAVRRIRPDVIHTHDYKSDTVAWLAARLPGARLPLVATMHGVVRTSAALRRYERLDARVLRRFAAVAAVSDGTMEIGLEYGIPRARLTLVPNGVDTAAFRPSPRAEARRLLGIPPDGPLIGVVGRLSEEKGQRILLEAFSRGEGLSPARLAVVGDGPTAADLKAIAGARVHFLGRREDMPGVYPAFDVLALPSLTEGLPLTILEAAACGVPAVASRVGDVHKAVVASRTGVLVPPADAAALADALADILADENRREAMGRAARAHVTEHFSEGAMAAAYAAIYRKVTGIAALRLPQAASDGSGEEARAPAPMESAR
jgi:glycosyltransferase involved in cell wall biosynthesis